MAQMTDQDFEEACERGRVEFETKPHASNARYDRNSGMVVLELYNGCHFSFPAREVQGLEDATEDQLSEVELNGVGYGLHWESLDVDITVPGLLQGRFGNDRYMVAKRAKLRAVLSAVLNDRRHAA